MGWKKSGASVQRSPTVYRASVPITVPLREPSAAGGIRLGPQPASRPETPLGPGRGAPAGPATETVSETLSGRDTGQPAGPAAETAPETPAETAAVPALENAGWQTVEVTPLGVEKRIRDGSGRVRWAVPTYDVSTGEDLEIPVNMDNSLLQVMFPDLEIALGQVPPPPPRSSPEQVEAHYQAALEDLARDLADQEGSARHGNMALDIATGARKEGCFLFTDGLVGRQVADTFEKIMAYGGLLASPCLQPPQHLEGVRVLVVPEGEMGTGDCAGKMSAELADLWGKDGSQAGQFRLGVRLDEGTVVVGKGTLKRDALDRSGREWARLRPDPP